MSKNNNNKKMLTWLKRTLLLKEKLFSEKLNAINISFAYCKNRMYIASVVL